jgi:NADH-quinone oxidoreductase subunit A
MSDFLRDYLTVVWFGAIALLLAGLLLGISALVGPTSPSVEKLTAYESGVDPVGDGWSQSQVRYYIFALLFVVFDVEAVFIFPWATSSSVTAGFGLVEMESSCSSCSLASCTRGARACCVGYDRMDS